MLKKKQNFQNHLYLYLLYFSCGSLSVWVPEVCSLLRWFNLCVVSMLMVSMCFVNLSTSLYPERSGVHRNGWYVCNALMQLGVFSLNLRNDTLLLALHSWGGLFFWIKIWGEKRRDLTLALFHYKDVTTLKCMLSLQRQRKFLPF